MRRIFLLYLIVITAWLRGNAQLLPSDTLTILQIAQEQGLSQLGATSLQFDTKGYLWVGTQNGLNRFNGYQMKVWLADGHTNNFPNDLIRAMHYENDTLWVTTHTNALCAYLLAEDRFIHFSEQLDFEKTPSLKQSLALHAVSDSLLIVGTAGHCLLFDRHELKYEVLQIPQLLEHDFVTCIQTLDEQKYLIGTNVSGLYILDIKSKSLYAVDFLKTLQGAQVNVLYKQPNDDLLIGTDRGLYVLTQDTKELTQRSKHVIRGIYPWDNGQLLMSGASTNFLLTEDGKWRNLTFLDHDGNELEAVVLAYQKDAQGGRWLGTETRGIFYYHPYQTKFKPQRIQASNAPKKDFISIFNFLRTANDLWMATEFGFVQHRLKSNDYKLHRTDFVGYTLARDDKGILWVGGYDQGLLRYNRKADKFDRIPLPVVDRDVIQITPISPDTIWVHTLAGGIYALNINNLETNPVHLLGNPILGSRTGYVDRKGNIWIGSENGLYQIQRNKEIIYYDSLSNERVFAITEDQQHLWVGTAKGLNKLNPVTGKITHYTKQTGLPNDFIYGVQVDNRNNIWVSTNYGISMLNQRTETFKNYTQDDGLQNNEFNGKAAYQDSLGYLYFGGMNGFNIFHPDSIPINTHTGKTHIENVLLFGRPIADNILYTDTLVFSHDQNVITLDFVNLNYLWSKKNRYQFMLEGFDKTWRPVTPDRSTTYTNLAPGTYTFKVRGSNNELLWGDIDEITVIIRSPWYATTAFRVGLALFVLALIAGGFSYKAYQQRLINRRLLRMVNERTEELSEANKALYQSLELTQQQKENISFLMQELNHRVKNNLQLITSLIDIQSFEISDQRIQDRLVTLQSRIFTVSKIHDLLNVRDIEQGVSVNSFIDNLAQDLITFSGQNIDFHSDIAQVILPSNKLTYIGLIINEMITNSIKHAFEDQQTNKTIAIRFDISGSDMILEYQDNGVGFNKDKMWDAGHQGMNLIHLLIAELKGTIDIEINRGTIFTIKLPTN